MDDFGNEIMWTQICDSGVGISCSTYGVVFDFEFALYFLQVDV